VSVSSNMCACIELRSGIVTAHIEQCVLKRGVLKSISDPPQT
jgi:hypothetical protein